MERLLIFLLLFFIQSLTLKAQVVGTPYLPMVNSDRIRSALAVAGCTSCSAYDAAASSTLVPITLAEYNAILANVTGATKKGYMGSMAGALIAFGTTGGVNNASPGTVDLLSPNSYIIAVAYQTYNTVTGHIRITASASPSTAQNCLTNISTPVAWTAYVTRYFTVKKPATHSGTNTYVGHINSSGVLYSTYPIASVGCRWGNNSCAGISGTNHPYAIGLQVVASTTKSW